MTVIGHLATATIVAGSTGLVKPKVTLRTIAYYVAVMAFFIAWIHYRDPKSIAALYIDWTGNLAGILFLALYARKGTVGERFFCAMLIGSQLLAGFSHPFDLLLLKTIGYVPEGIWRPQHFWHTPLFGFTYCLLVSGAVWKLLKMPRYTLALGGLCLGYALHITADTITYEFPIYWFWPFSDWGWAMTDAFVPSFTGVATTFGHVLYKFGDVNYNPHWGWVIYQTEPLINVLLAGLFCVQLAVRAALYKTSVENLGEPNTEVPLDIDQLPAGNHPPADREIDRPAQRA
jgi:hypothetical protein